MRRTKKYTQEEFIEKVENIYCGKIDFSNFQYINNKTKGWCKCNICGHNWQTIPAVLVKGHQCPKCANKEKGLKRRLDSTIFMKRVKEMHGDKYNYDKIDYTTMRDFVTLSCNHCKKEFKIRALDLVNGHGCPNCNKSLLENEIEQVLKSFNIDFISQYRPKFLKGKSIDFFLPQINLGIECQGLQHFIKSRLWPNILEENKRRDTEKYYDSIKHDIELVYFQKKRI